MRAAGMWGERNKAPVFPVENTQDYCKNVCTIKTHLKWLGKGVGMCKV